jgi:hypothetical protein
MVRHRGADEPFQRVGGKGQDMVGNQLAFQESHTGWLLPEPDPVLSGVKVIDYPHYAIGSREPPKEIGFSLRKIKNVRALLHWPGEDRVSQFRCVCVTSASTLTLSGNCK